MSQKVDRTGERTLAVVTKPDKAPEGLLEKVTADDVNIGLGYVCVRNRIGDESYEEARMEEARLFDSHPLLSKINKSIVGVPVLAQKLVQIQATSIGRSLPDIVKNINGKLNQNVEDMKKLPQNLTTMSEAVIAFMRVLSSAKESLKKILVRGEFEEYVEAEMHCTARLADKLNDFSKELQHRSDNYSAKEKFLMEEISVLQETKAIGLPNFLPRAAFLTVLQRKVKEVSDIPIDFVQMVWSYIEEVVVKVVSFHADAYPQLQNSIRRATHNLILKVKDKSVERVKEIVEMEKLADYTCNPEYTSIWNDLMTQQNNFLTSIADATNEKKFTFAEYGEINVHHLRQYQLVVVEQAFDMKMRLTAYWKIVLKRLVDSLGLHLLYSIQNLINKEMEQEIIHELMGLDGGVIGRLLEEPPSVSSKREKLNKSISLLKKSKEVMARIMDRIAAHGDCSE
ncbi:dynamin-related protein 4C [Thalictrum thalictroides]|uniref:Dynamin-related protein 4C n=1 Tax=Thalictrum thalictroides TaxID=46969 RepID=A0A7J6VDB4_THATH|nr:dynamin-related protein 4C [Thalictrum thalictroides]